MKEAEAVLLACSGTRQGHAEVARIRSLLQERVHWERLLWLAERHGLASLVYRSVTALDLELPPDIREALRARSHESAQRGLLLIGELLRINRLFRSHGIPALAYKGPALALFLYGDVGARVSTDLDILVPRRQAARASDLLIADGYRPLASPLTPRQLEFTLRSQYHVQLARHSECGWIPVELHWALASRDFSLPMEESPLWERAQPVRVGAEDLFIHGTEDLFLILSFHGYKHLWERLLWCCDVAQLVRSSSEVHWDRLLGRAEALGMRRVLFLGLRLAHDLFRVDLPEAVWRRIETDRTVAGMAERFSGRLFEERPELPARPRPLPFYWEALPSYWNARERLSDRARDTWYRILGLFTPTPREWTLLPLPDSLFPLYHLLRPIRLVGRYGAMLLSAGSKRLDRRGAQALG